MAVKNLIFDIGNVLIGFRPEEMLKEYGMSEEKQKEFAEKIFMDEIWKEFDLENIPYQAVVDRYVEKYPELKEEIAWVFSHTELMPIYRPRVWEKLHLLKEDGYHIYLLTNYSSELMKSHLTLADFWKDIDGMVASYQLHVVKPDPVIYRTLLEKYQLKAEECVFFDDMASNVEGAKAVGIEAHQITDEQQLLDLMQAYHRKSLLANAIRFEEEGEAKISEEERPVFHLTPRTGWMNDPNGFSYYNGQYHMFYQYYPYDVHWGPMHWGHAVSKDMLHWEALPTAIAPDEVYDRDGCFSGSAIDLPDGRQLLMYTGVDRTPTPDGTLVDRQTQALAIGDGVKYEKIAGNPILDEHDLPDGCSIADFRDPKMVHAEDGTYRMYSVTNMPGRGGALLQFTSADGMDWHFKSRMLINDYKIGKMWECPDVFTLDGKDVFLASSQDMQAEGMEYDNGNGTFVMLGKINEEDGTFVPETDQCVDYGLDFYAQQTVLAPDGRRIMMAWMQNWDTINQRTMESKWYGSMTIPREVWIKDNRFYQWPTKELEEMRREKAEYKQAAVGSEAVSLDGVKGRVLDLEVEITPDGAGWDVFTVEFAGDGRFKSMLTLDARDNTVEIDRRYSGTRRAAIHQRKTDLQIDGGKVSLRLVLDRFSVEAFINGGEKAMTMTLETPLDAEQIAFKAKGSAKIDVTAYQLEK